MERSEIAKVAVSAATFSIDRPYDYLIPQPMLEKARPGVRVSVPFGRGNRSCEGVILARETGPKRAGVKPLASVLDDEPVLDGWGVSLALWMRQRYFCTMYEAVKTILPAGLWYRLREVFTMTEGLDRTAAEDLAGKMKHAGPVLDAVFASGGSAELTQLKAVCGEDAEPTLRALCKKGVLSSSVTSTRRVSDKQRRMAELTMDGAEALALVEPRKKSAPMRYEVVLLLSATGRASVRDICYFTGASVQTLKGLEKSGIVAFSEEERLRIPEPKEVEPGPPIVLNDEQQSAFERILALTQSGKAEAALLQGVTGSGKTQIYIRLAQEVLKQGRSVLVLVPEIVLTPQMMEKFSSYFGGAVAMLHSSLRMTERYDQWKRIRRGEARLVLGTRSAVFAPLVDLGLVIMDEEQEGSYASENAPRYHTRDVAKFRCAQSGAALVLGSATPAVETAWSAKQGQYHHELLRRRYNEQSLPDVQVVDLRQEIKAGNSGALSGPLRQELQENLERGEQSILFLNRRGNSRMLVCGECGNVPSCPRCSVSMTYHSANGRLMCHYCGHSRPASDVCPECGGIMKHIGAGTQRVEEELRDLFPGVGVLRMDADTAGGDHETLLSRFERERIPILLGTQMVAKGLDFENVTLVGVLSADASLYLDNYRAAERTFSLLTQVVGRAGRGGKSGRAVIQTYTPGNEVIQSAALQDYERFYDSEIALRRIRRYPPFADLFTLTVSGGDEGAVFRAAMALRDELVTLMADTAVQETEPEMIGPAPAPVLKVNNRFRYRVFLSGKNDKPTRDRVAWLLREFGKRRENRGLNLFADCNAMD
ncbi:primosomal protein N' [uncultured Oscillibacter sp.]|uniref:replication restart helicase PriA n=1 Tax=uncultured Oscillibacter sp. TaxID=876091 RepID=UPI0025D1A60B|nr:primosomal protein N' [uncultured Oscillibacter sp.]